MIEIKNLSFAYGKKEILHNISAEFHKAGLYCIIGPNGSGKTTLINLLARLNKSQSGELFLESRSFEAISRKDFAKKIALLPQGRNIPSMTVRDLVSCGRFPYLGMSRRLSAEDRLIVEKSLRATSTESFAGISLKKLSGGERQRVYIAMLMAQDSPYVLLDEPTTHLDISAKFEIMELLENMKHEGKCVIAVLHDLDLALKYADGIILLDGGKVADSGSPEEIVSRGRLRDSFGISCEKLNIEGETVYYFKP